MARWALGLGTTTILAGVLVWVLSATFSPDQAPARWAIVAVIVLILLAFIAGLLSLVFGMRSQWELARSQVTFGASVIAIVGWVSGLFGLAVTVIWLLFLVASV